MINIYRKQNEDMLEEMLATYVQIGKIDEAKKYLNDCKSTFSRYNEWSRILDVHADVKQKGLGKVVKLVLDNEFEDVQ